MEKLPRNIRDMPHPAYIIEWYDDRWMAKIYAIEGCTSWAFGDEYCFLIKKWKQMWLHFKDFEEDLVIEKKDETRE